VGYAPTFGSHIDIFINLKQKSARPHILAIYSHMKCQSIGLENLNFCQLPGRKNGLIGGRGEATFPSTTTIMTPKTKELSEWVEM
jgi:hypothetical protein